MSTQSPDWLKIPETHKANAALTKAPAATARVIWYEATERQFNGSEARLCRALSEVECEDFLVTWWQDMIHDLDYDDEQDFHYIGVMLEAISVERRFAVGLVDASYVNES